MCNRLFKDGGVGREALQQDQFRGEAEDGDAGVGRSVLKEVEELLVDVDLINQRGVEGIEENDVEGAVGGDRSVVGEGTGRHGWHQFRRCGWCRLVLFEVANGLRVLAFEEGEIGGFKIVNRMLTVVGDGDVYDDDLGAGLEGGYGCAGG